MEEEITPIELIEISSQESANSGMFKKYSFWTADLFTTYLRDFSKLRVVKILKISKFFLDVIFVSCIGPDAIGSQSENRMDESKAGDMSIGDPAHDTENAVPGDPEQKLPLFERLLFQHLQTMDGIGMPVDEIKQDCSAGKFY